MSVVGEREVNGIRTTLLEWEVAADERFQAFDSVNALTSHGGTLRIYVAEQLAYAIPRIEHVGSEGVIQAVHESSDFVETAPGIFLPRHSKKQIFDASGPTYYEDYDITRAEKINEPIPENEFTKEFPPETLVSDLRDEKKPRTFSVRQEAVKLPLSDATALPKAILPTRSWYRDWRLAVFLGFVAGVAAAIAYYAHRRRLPRS